MVNIIEYFGWKYVAAVAVDHSYGRYGIRALERESYNRKSFCIAMVEYFTRSGYKGQIKSIVEKLNRESNIQVIVFWSNYEPARRFLEEATQQKLFGRTFLVSEALATIGKDVLQRHASVLGSSLGIMPHQYEDQRFVSYLRNVTPSQSRQTGNPWWREFWETTYNCTTADLSKTYEICDDSLTVGDRYHKLYNSFIPYLTDAVYAIAHALNLMLRCGNDGCEGSLKLKELTTYMRNVSFKGLTGNVRFSNEGNPINSFYDVVNFHQNTTSARYTIVPVGSWQGRDDVELLLINASDIHWNTKDNRVPESACSKTCSPGYKQTDTVACCWECFPCPEGWANPYPGYPNCTKCPKEQRSNAARTKCVDLPVINIQLDNPITIIIVALNIIGLLVTFLATGVYVFFRDTPIVKASNRELSFLLLSIIILCFVLTFLHLIRPSEALCFLINPWRYITSTACVSILYLKTNRLVSAFQTNVIPSWFKKYILDRKRQLAVAFLLNLIQFVFTILWLTIDSPYMYKDIRPQQYIFLTCRAYHTTTGLVIRSVMFFYFIFLAFLCSLYAFKARGLPENFSEAKYIGFSMYILLVSWIVYYPVDSTLEGSYITIVACATALLTAYGLLGCLFVPKMYIMLRHPEQNTVAFVKAEVGQFSNSFRVPVPASLQVNAFNRVSPSNEQRETRQ